MKNLETKNLRIRKFKIEDVKDVYENLATEKELADSLDYNVHRNIEETKKILFSYIKEYEMGEFVWAIEEKQSNIVIGMIKAQEMSRENKCCKIKFEVGAKWRKSNYMEEALKKVLNYLLDEEEFNIVISNFYDGNEEITKKKEDILKNVGMTKEACLRNRKINLESGKSENKIVYSITKEEIA